MFHYASTAVILATLSKHKLVGIIAIVIGAAFLIFGGSRLLMKVATAPLIPLFGVIVVVIGILLYTRAI